MRYEEQAVVFECADEPLIGILSVPLQPADTAVIVVVGGPQYRVGSHRQFVSLARSLAGAGIAAFRFDCRGMGDSRGIGRSFQAIGPDIAAAIDALTRRLEHVRKVILWGLCDGASAALLYCDATHDARVAGLCLVNPWVRSEATLARTNIKHYYRRRLLERSFWTKLCRGWIAPGAIRGLLRNMALARSQKPASEMFQDRMAGAWHEFAGPMLLLLSGNDYTAKEFLEHVRSSAAWAGALERERLERHDLAAANHTFSDPADQARMEEFTLEWITRAFRDGQSGSRPAPRLANVE